jgi:class 3 adenylate cyclase
LDDAIKQREEAMLEKAEAQQLALERLIENERMMIQQNEVLEKMVAERTRELNEEKRKTDELLLSILPKETAEELKKFGKVAPKHFEEVTVLFADFVGFTAQSANLSPEELIEEINHCFCEFDKITERYRVEKIKTIGDAYMCAEGVPVHTDYNIYSMIIVALEMVSFSRKNREQKLKLGKPAFDIRIGIHTGPVMAGVVGLKKFNYDIWGDTVNVAARMESSSEAGRVNISETTYQKIKDKYPCTFRGEIEVKGKGAVKMYFLNH